MTYKFLGLLIGGLVLAFGVCAGPAMAAKVSVEVEGLSVTVPPTVVETPAGVSKGGQSCPDGQNIIGALDVLTKGDWDGSINGATRILSEDHPFVPQTPGWVFVINGKATADYGCGAHLNDGDKVLWYASAGTPNYPSTHGGWADPVLLDAPTTAVPGQAFTVTATDTTTSYDQYDTPTSTTFAPSGGATVSGGTGSVTTGADGKASVTVGGGPYTLVVTKGNRAPTRIAGCATTGSDGLCGTTKTSTPGPPEVCSATAATACAAPPDKVAALSRVTGITEGKKYAKGHGPRQLTGKTDPEVSGIADIQLRLTRTDGKKCSTYDGKTEKFKTIKKCGATHGIWFSVGAQPSWTYLLPSKLARGRYVLDVKVIDKAGNKTTKLARGTSRVVFTVA